MTKPAPPIYALDLTEAEAIDLCSGYVPSSIKAMLLLALDAAAEDRRRANRPEKPARTGRIGS